MQLLFYILIQERVYVAAWHILQPHLLQDTQEAFDDFIWEFLRFPLGVSAAMLR